MVMELLSGPSLREEIDLEAPMAPARVVAILEPVASALQLAHDRGITHRDLKPANIVAHRYESGERVYKVIDFGLAAMKADERSDAADRSGVLPRHAGLCRAGTDARRGRDRRDRRLRARRDRLRDADRRRVRFDAANQATLITQTLTETPVERRGAPQRICPQAIDAAVMKALGKDVGDRWPSVTTFIDALQRRGRAQSPAAAAIGRRDRACCRATSSAALVGRGRLGSLVYRGTHRALGVPVAIRVLKRDEQPHWDAVRARFLLEARTLQVAHPSLLQVRDFGEDERSVYLVTDLIDGPSLRQAMAEAGPMPWPRAANLLDAGARAPCRRCNARGGFICGVNPDMIRIARRAGSDSPMSAS